MNLNIPYLSALKMEQVPVGNQDASQWEKSLTTLTAPSSQWFPRLDPHALVRDTFTCDIVIYNKKYIPDLRSHLRHRAPNFGISRVTEVREVFSVISNEPLSTKQEFILMRWLLVGPWTAWGQVAGTKRTNPVIRGLALSAPPTTSTKGRRAR